MLDINNSRYVDFQKVRIQETQAELPRGSIPRRFVDLFYFLALCILDKMKGQGTGKICRYNKVLLYSGTSI